MPVEVVRFGWETTAERLARLQANPVLRRDTDGQPFVTDGGHYILDCGFGPIDDPATLEQGLSGVVGVVETGLFIGMAEMALVADDAGVRKMVRVA